MTDGTVYEPPGGFDDVSVRDLIPIERTDLGNARLFAEEHGARFRYVVAQRRWLVWQGGRWRTDEDAAVVRAAKETIEAMLRRAVDLDGKEREKAMKYALQSQSEPSIRRLLALAGSEAAFALAPSRLDADPWLLACGNGTIDLRTGELRPHDPKELISLGTDIAYDPEANCPRWEQFLLEVFAGDVGLIAYMQRALGYCLTGDTREHVLFVCHGTGRNGKGTLLETFKKAAGDFAQTAAFATFMRTRHDHGPRNDLAGLHRARLVLASESTDGRTLDEATVKTLTGGDTVAARFLYGEYFEFKPGFKIVLSTNYRPRVSGDDEAIWARLRLIPFTVSFLGREEKDLPEKLEAELPGILRWAIEGCLAWQREGLGDAAAVTTATSEYRQAEDALGAFLAERCEVDQHATVPAGDLRAAYEEHCSELGEKPLAASVLGRQLARRGIRADVPSRGRRVYLGLRLTVHQTPDTPTVPETNLERARKREVPGTSSASGASGAHDEPLF